MRKKNYIRLGGSFIGIGSFMLGIPSALPLQSAIISLVATVGTSIGVTGILFIAAPFMPKIEDSKLVIRRLKRNDLRDVYNYCGGFFGDNFSSYNQMKAWFDHNEKMFWILEENRRKGKLNISKIVGFYWSLLDLCGRMGQSTG